MAKAAAVGPARDAGYWRDRVAALGATLGALGERQEAMTADRAAVALEAHAGDARAARRLERLGADLEAAARERAGLDAAVGAAEAKLAQAEEAETEKASAARRARREALMKSRAANARRAEGLIDSLGKTLAEMRVQAEEIMALTAGRDMAETLKPIKTDHRLQLAMSGAGFTWRNRQAAAHPLFPDAPGFAEAEIAAQAAYAGMDVR